MNLEELRSARATERRKDSLQHLRDSFYDDVADYVAELRDARDRRAAEVSDPFADEQVRRMTDEIETAEEVATALYERRIGKVVKLASFEAADMSTDPEGMTDSERALYDDLVDRIERNKAAVLGAFAGDTDLPDGTGSLAPEADGRAGADSPPRDPAAAPPERESADSATAGRASDADAEPEPTDRASEASAGGALADAMGPSAGSETGADAESAPEPASEPTPDANGGDASGHRSVDPAPPPPDGGPDAGRGGGPAGDGPTPGRGAGPADDGSNPDREGSPDAGSGPAPGSAADDSGTGSGTGTGTDGPGDADRTTVRITRDVGAILGVDEREYDLATEDVVALPTANAEPLVDRGAAERLDPA